MSRCTTVSPSGTAGPTQDNLRLRPLTDQDSEKVQLALQGNPDDVLFVSLFSIQLVRSKFQSLRPRQWLVDEPINIIMEILQERANAGDRSQFIPSSFFYERLSGGGNGYNYSNIEGQWRPLQPLRKGAGWPVDYKIFMPINVGNWHWVLGEIDFPSRKINVYDHSKIKQVNGLEFVRVLCKWIKDEANSKGHVFDINEWTTTINPENTPEQTNGFDCGVFVCTTAEWLSEGSDLTFSQEDMPHLRKRMALTILRRGEEEHARSGQSQQPNEEVGGEEEIIMN